MDKLKLLLQQYGKRYWFTVWSDNDKLPLIVCEGYLLKVFSYWCSFDYEGNLQARQSGNCTTKKQILNALKQQAIEATKG